MNKLVLNPKARNHFKFYPVKERELPENEADQIKLVEKLYEDLVNKGIILYTKSKSGNYSIRCVQLDSKYYIILSMKNEFGTYNNTIFENNLKNDALAISVFIGKNIKQMMSDYKQQILDAKDMMVRKEGEDEIREISEIDN